MQSILFLTHFKILTYYFRVTHLSRKLKIINMSFNIVNYNISMKFIYLLKYAKIQNINALCPKWVTQYYFIKFQPFPMSTSVRRDWGVTLMLVILPSFTTPSTVVLCVACNLKFTSQSFGHAGSNRILPFSS